MAHPLLLSRTGTGLHRRAENMTALRQLVDDREGVGPMNWMRTPLGRNSYEELKVRIHRKLLDTIDLNKISALESPRVESDVRHILDELVMAEPFPLSHHDRQRLVIEIEH